MNPDHFLAMEKLVRGQAFVLDDAEGRSLEHPETFQIPSSTERFSLKPGDLAKLIFMRRGPAEIDQPNSERMWVKVTGVISSGEIVFYTGVLRNEAAFLPIPFNAPVVFRPHHVADLMKEAEAVYA